MFYVSRKKALRFFEENYIMIHSLQTKSEEGCTDNVWKYYRNQRIFVCPFPLFREQWMVTIIMNRMKSTKRFITVRIAERRYT